MQLISTSEVQAVVASVEPVCVAVAYVGEDWQYLLGSSQLSEIIVSPTLGSNPESIAEIVEKLRWDNVYFLRQLHSKIYLGNAAAAFGSFNLSRNGIATEGLEEFGALTQDADHVSIIKAEFLRLKCLAIAAYPSERQKREALQQLRGARDLAAARGVIPFVSRANSLREFRDLTDHDFHVVWYSPYTPEFNESAIVESAPEIPTRSFTDNTIVYTTVLESDPIKEGDWLLIWKARANGLPDRRSPPYWLYADCIIPNGVSNDAYTKLVVQKPATKPPTPPFSISDTEIKRAIYDTLSTEPFRALRRDGDKDWSIVNSRECLTSFIAALRSTTSQ